MGVGVLFLLNFDCIGAQDPPQAAPFVVDLEAAASGTPVVLNRPENGVVALNIIYTGTVDSQAQILTNHGIHLREWAPSPWILLTAATQLPNSLSL